jgi:hypothetical protein
LDFPDSFADAAARGGWIVTALVASWVLILLTVLSVSFGHQVASSAHQTQWDGERQHLATLARSGVALSQCYLDRWIDESQPDLAGLLTPADEAARPALDLSWQDDPRLRAVPVGRGYVSIGYVRESADGPRTIHGIRDENSRVPVSLLDARAAQRLGGLSPEAVEALAVLRADPDRFRNVDPRSWPGLDARSRETLDRLVTAYATTVNINTASVEVLTALGIPAPGARKLLTRRDGPDGVAGTADDRLFTSLDDPEGGLRDCNLSGDEAAMVTFLAGRGHLTTRSDVFRVRSRGWVKEYGPWCEIEAVLDCSSGGWEVRSWTQRRNG